MTKAEEALDWLEAVTNAVLGLVEDMGRPLLEMEARPVRKLLVYWESKRIQSAIAKVDEGRLPYYRGLIASLVELVEPAPVDQLRLQTVQAVKVGERHAGNFAHKRQVLQGLTRRRLNAEEVQQLLNLLVKLAENVAVIVWEITLVTGKNKSRMERIGRKVKSLCKDVQDYLAYAKPIEIPPEPSEAEILDDMRRLEEFREPGEGE